MKGRDLIIYILKNELENEDIFSEKFLSCLPTIESVAVSFGVGVATVEAWVENDCLCSLNFNGQVYITPNSLDTFAEKMGRKEVDNV